MTARVVVPVSGGFRMHVEMRDVVGNVLATSGVWEPYVVEAMSRTLREGDVCADVGAHIGYHTLVASTLVGALGHVYALEPSPRAFRELRANLELNAVRNVTAVSVAAGAAEGRGRLIDSERHNSGRTSIQREERGAPTTAAGRVEIRTLGAVLEPAHVERLTLVKIDVEGFEAEVLAGIEELFERGARPSMIVELHGHGGREAVQVIGRLMARYELKAFELVRNPRLHRFSPTPLPRPVAKARELVAICETRPVNVLLEPPGAGVA